jgi:hypothetical protein
MDMADLKKTLREVIPEEWNANHFLNSVGLEMRRSRASSIVPIGLAFAGGLIVGGIAALMFAPKSGIELRSDLEDKLDKAKTKASDFVKSKRGAKGEKGEKESSMTDEGESLESSSMNPSFT